jgi:oligoendopeptidase F
MAKSEVAWDLSEIFPRVTDPSVQKAMDDITAVAEKFAEKYRGKIKDFSAEELCQCLEEYEVYYARLREILLFANLSFAANMTLPENQQLHDKAVKLETKLGKLLAFFELEVSDLVYRKPELISDPVLANYRHFLERLRRRPPISFLKLKRS